jgi:hypothetical protein
MRASATWVAPSSPSYGEAAPWSAGWAHEIRKRWSWRRGAAVACSGHSGSKRLWPVPPGKPGARRPKLGRRMQRRECPLDGLEIEPGGTRVVARLRRSCRFLGSHECGVSLDGRGRVVPGPSRTRPLLGASGEGAPAEGGRLSARVSRPRHASRRRLARERQTSVRTGGRCQPFPRRHGARRRWRRRLGVTGVEGTDRRDPHIP